MDDSTTPPAVSEEERISKHAIMRIANNRFKEEAYSILSYINSLRSRLSQKEEECETYKRDLRFQTVMNKQEEIDELKSQLFEKEEECRGYREALQFYADGKHVVEVYMHYHGTVYHAKDRGELARVALSPSK